MSDIASFSSAAIATTRAHAMMIQRTIEQNV
jgi:hypothetical protein